MRDTIKDIWGYLTETDKGRVILALVVVFGLGIWAGKAWGADYTVTCDPPTERADGTPLTLAEIANYEWWVDGVMDGTSTTCSYVLSKPDGTYNVQAKTVDTGGRVSVASPGKSISLTTSPPNPPRLH